MRDKILAARLLPQEFIDQMKQFAEVDVWDSELEPMPREEFLKRSKEATVVITTFSEKSINHFSILLRMLKVL